MTSFRTALDWSRYNETQVNRAEARDLARKVLELAGTGSGRRAIDVGCGAGIETHALLERGWVVLGIDHDPMAAEFTASRLTDEQRSRLTFMTKGFADIADLPPSDLIHAAWALPYAGRDLVRVWGVLVRALRPGGWIACELFGDRDSHASDPDVATLTRDEVAALTEPLDVVSLESVEQDSNSFGGQHHYHVFTLIARKR